MAETGFQRLEDTGYACKKERMRFVKKQEGTRYNVSRKRTYFSVVYKKSAPPVMIMAMFTKTTHSEITNHI